MQKGWKILVTGHRGLVGSALVRRLEAGGYQNLLTRTRAELDLLDQRAVHEFLDREKPDYIFGAAAKVGGIQANNRYRADFIYENLLASVNLVHGAHLAGVQRMMFLGSSCIYPRDCPQPMREEYLLSGPLEPTNEPYAVAKIAGLKLCESYNAQYGRQYVSVMFHWGHTFLSLWFGAMLLSVLLARGTFGAAPLRARLTRFAGKISYSLYLFHPLVLSAVFMAAGRPELVRGLPDAGYVLCALVLTVTLCWLLSRFVETPAIRSGRLLKY